MIGKNREVIKYFDGLIWSVNYLCLPSLYCVRPLIFIFHNIIDNDSDQASYDHRSYERN